MSDQARLSVYGASGFVGTRFCRLSKHVCEIIPREQREPVSDEILYLISTTHNYHVFDDLQKDVDTNLKVFLEVLGKAKERRCRINFISSWFVYGETELPAREDSICSPKGFYSITKRCAEELLISFCKTFGLEYRILRLCNVYGPQDTGVSAKKNALQYLISRIKASEEVGLYHGGDFYRDYMHVDDVARAIDLCVEKAPVNEIINIGSGEKVVFRELMDHAIEVTGSHSKINHTVPPEFHEIVQIKDFYMDNTKLKNLGFRPEVNLKQGIEALCR